MTSNSCGQMRRIVHEEDNESGSSGSEQSISRLNTGISLYDDATDQTDDLFECGDVQHSTLLHRACSKRDVDTHVLRQILRDNPDAAFMREKDSMNTLPLRLLLLNPKRILDDEDLFEFCLELIGTNPSALLCRDKEDQGRLLFFKPVWFWIKKTNRKNKTRNIHMRLHKSVPTSTCKIPSSVDLIFRILSALIDDQINEIKKGKLAPELSIDEVLVSCLIQVLSHFLSCNLFILIIISLHYINISVCRSSL